MQTDLDRDITRITDAVTADGQMFALKTVTRRGVDMPAFVNAPPSLAHYFAHFCNQNKDALFLVDGEQRLTFGDEILGDCLGLKRDHGDGCKPRL